MKIQFNGAAQTVTGSQYLITVNSKLLLLECGLFQGRRKDFYEKNLYFQFDPRQVDAAILTHAHIDHCGNFPNLVKQGYMGRIYVTRPTAKLAELVLLDSGHIHESDAEYVNKKRFRRGEPPIQPLYTRADAERVAAHFSPKEYGEVFEPIPGVTARFVDAGHILGSAGVVLDIRENGRTLHFWFSGDIGRPNLPLIDDPVLPETAEYLMMECTYGDKVRPEHQAAYEELRDAVARTIERNGKVIIPAFAVGRTQEIVYDLNRMYSSGELPRIPIYVDSPLAVGISRVFQEFSHLFDDEARTFYRTGKHPALSFDGLTYIESVEESKALNDRREPMVIISASGMAETGRILHHLKNNIEDARNTVVIVSWQSPETLGRRLAERETKVKIFGEYYHRRAEVVTIGGFSAHGDQSMLLKYALATRSHLKKVFLVHGEPQAAVSFEAKLRENGITDIEYVKMYQSVDL
ncbi:MAG: MBL fold metallo-hydrolase [Anaerolineae bacterium]|nr:MBL fold metallo-hydrolase [Anaerolineae bacterium]